MIVRKKGLEIRVSMQLRSLRVLYEKKNLPHLRPVGDREVLCIEGDDRIVFGSGFSIPISHRVRSLFYPMMESG